MRVRDERGFSLVELMVVVVVIGILVAIALPTFLGAQGRANDGATQTNVRNAFGAEKVYLGDADAFTDVVASIQAIEPALIYASGDTPAVVGVVYLHHHPATGEVYISSKSDSETCFYLRSFPDESAEFARSASCGVADLQTYGPSW